MSIYRIVKKQGRYLLADAEAFEDRKLSFDARGMLAYLLTKPDDWQVNKKELTTASPAGKFKIQNIINELKTAGYMRRTQMNDPKTGEFTTITDVFEIKSLNPDFNSTTPPIYGGTKNNSRTVTQKPVHGIETVTHFTGDGKPGHIPNTDLNNINKGDPKNFNWYEHDDLGYQGPSKEEINGMVITLTSVCKGFANVLMPDGCEFHQTASTLIENGITEEQVRAFTDWWKHNGQYEGKPAVKSLRDNIENAMAGISANQEHMEQGAWDLVLLWLNRKAAIEDLNSSVKIAIGRVGESYIKSMNSQNEKVVRNKFMEAYREVLSA